MAKRYNNEDGYNVEIGAKRNGFLRTERAYTLKEARGMMRDEIKAGAAIVYIYSRKTGNMVEASD